jgi:hypothetical protein
MRRTLVVLLAILVPSLIQAQGTFQNLDFEQVTLVPFAGSQILYYASDALPDWTVYMNTTPQQTVLYDNLTAGGPAVSIHDSLSPYIQPLQGNYSVILQTGVENTAESIGQTGQLPQNASSVVFYVAHNDAELQLTFDGNAIPLVELGTTANYSILGGDISAFAGQTGQLLFTENPGGSYTVLDDIQFSSSPVPEPSTLGLFTLGSLAFGWSFFRKRK